MAVSETVVFVPLITALLAEAFTPVRPTCELMAAAMAIALELFLLVVTSVLSKLTDSASIKSGSLEAGIATVLLVPFSPMYSISKSPTSSSLG